MIYCNGGTIVVIGYPVCKDSTKYWASRPWRIRYFGPTRQWQTCLTGGNVWTSGTGVSSVTTFIWTDLFVWPTIGLASLNAGGPIHGATVDEVMNLATRTGSQGPATDESQPIYIVYEVRLCTWWMVALALCSTSVLAWDRQPQSQIYYSIRYTLINAHENSTELL